jgi:hypothetical protein
LKKAAETKIAAANDQPEWKNAPNYDPEAGNIQTNYISSRPFAQFSGYRKRFIFLNLDFISDYK